MGARERGRFLGGLLVATVGWGGYGARVASAEQPAVAPAPPPPAPSAVVERLLTRYVWQADGTGDRIMSARVRINDEAGVSEWGELAFSYVATLESFALDTLTVTKPDGRVVRVTDAPSEDTAVSGQADEPVLSDQRLRRVTVPALQPGDVLEYRAVVRRSQALVPGHFWVDHTFSRYLVSRDEVLEIDVPRSRAVHVAAQLGTPDSTMGAEAGRAAWRWRHRMDDVPVRPDEQELRIAELRELARRGPDVSLSSFDGWEQLGTWFAAVAAERAAPDEAVRAKAAELTKGLDTPREKLDALYAYVGANVRYVSLAFGTGRYEPRPASRVLATLYGDCKDKHVLFAALARAVGLDVRPVLISNLRDLDDRVPSPGQFDHVISAFRTTPLEEWRWFDATTGLTPPGGLLSTLRNRRALVAGPGQNSVIVRTPEMLPTPASARIAIEGTLELSGAVSRRVTRTVIGDMEYAMRALMRGMTPQAREEIGRAQMADDGLRSGATASDVAFTDLGIGRGVEFAYTARHAMALQQSGPWRFWLPTPGLLLPEPPRTAALRDRPLELGLPSTITLSARYVLPASVKVKAPLPVEVKHAFATYRSSYRVEPGAMALERRVELLVDRIAPTDFAAYEALRRAIDADYRQVFMAETVGETAAPVTAEDFHTAAVAARAARDPRKAVGLLEKATSLDAKHKAAWHTLGLAQLDLKQFEPARLAFEKAIALDPFHEDAYAELGRAEWGLQRYDDAARRFEKQIEVVPLHKSAHAWLGELLLQRDRPAESAAALERAAQITPDTGRVWLLLGQARLGSGQTEAAVEAFERGVGIMRTPHAWNEAAWALAKKGVALDRATEWVGHAIAGTANRLRDVALERLTQDHLNATASLAAYWDTLGWIRVQQGDMAGAEPWLAAALTLGRHPEVAEHLARVEAALAQAAERSGDRAGAIDRYARAASLGGRADARKALVRLVGAAEVERRVDEATLGMNGARAPKVKTPAPAQGEAELFLLLDETGAVTATRVRKGGEGIEAAIAAVTGMVVGPKSPGGTPLALVRQGALGCGRDTGCAIVLLDAPEARLPDAR